MHGYASPDIYVIVRNEGTAASSMEVRTNNSGMRTYVSETQIQADTHRLIGEASCDTLMRRTPHRYLSNSHEIRTCERRGKKMTYLIMGILLGYSGVSDSVHQ